MQIRKFIDSVRYALSGLRQVFREEQNFRIHAASALVVAALSVFVFHFSYIEICLTLLCISFVLVAEVINSAIEKTWDHLEPNHHPVVKSVKDMMAAAVLVASVFSAILWILLIFNKLF